MSNTDEGDTWYDGYAEAKAEYEGKLAAAEAKLAKIRDHIAALSPKHVNAGYILAPIRRIIDEEAQP